jgi:hypothetical protein
MAVAENKYEAARPDALGPDEPFFFLRAQDALAPFAVQAYANLMHASGVAAQDAQLVMQAGEVHRIAAQMLAWQARNATKMPD